MPQTNHDVYFVSCGDTPPGQPTAVPSTPQQEGYGYSFGNSPDFAGNQGDVPGTVHVNPPWAAPYNPGANNHQVIAPEIELPTGLSAVGLGMQSEAPVPSSGCCPTCCDPLTDCLVGCLPDCVVDGICSFFDAC